MPKQNLVRFQDDWNESRNIEIDGNENAVSFFSFVKTEDSDDISEFCVCVELNKDSLKDLISALKKHYSKMA